MEKDLYNNTKVLLGMASQTISTDTTTSGAIIDTAGFESAVWGVVSGTITDGAYTGRIWESDDSGMSGATVVTTAQTLGGVDFVAADDDAIRRIGSVGKLRYQQLRIVSTSTSSGGTLFGSQVTLGDPAHLPVDAQST